MTFLEKIAIRKAKTEGWLPCIFECITDDAFMVMGGVPVGTKNGRAKWGPKKTLTKVVITQSEIETEEAHFEAETGKCKKCLGEGKVVSRISINEPTEYRECFKCKGSGISANGAAYADSP